MSEKLFTSQRSFTASAKVELADGQLRSNLSRATHTIREKRATVVSELPNWESLRDKAAYIKDYTLANLDSLIAELETSVTQKGGQVHFAHDNKEANEIVSQLVKQTGATSVVKVKSMTTAEIDLNAALQQIGVASYETDLAELIVQLDNDLPSHILVPAIHKNRSQIREIFLNNMGGSGVPAPKNLSNDPKDLAAAARTHLRDRFLKSTVGISGANFLIAESGSVVVVESEGNGRMCLTLPETLISVVGIEKLLPDWNSLSVFLQLLPRSSTGERMNPYTSIFSGVSPGDGPSNFHLVLLDNGRTRALRDPVGRQALRCIRCSACLNVCPVYERVGGHAYGSPYPGPIGAVLLPQLRSGNWGALERSLPYASTLCGACYEVCPVKIEIPKLLVELRSQVVNKKQNEHLIDPEITSMWFVKTIFASTTVFQLVIAAAQLPSRLLKLKRIRHLPPPLNRWTDARDLRLPSGTSFRDWLKTRHPESIDNSFNFPTERRRSRVFSASIIPHLLGLKQIKTTVVSPLKGKPAVLKAISDSYSAHESLRGASLTSTFVSENEDKAKDDLVTLFKSRLIDYKANVYETSAPSLSQTIAETISQRKSTSVVVPSDLPASWYQDFQATIVSDSKHLTVKELDNTSSALTGCALAIAETGTIVLDSGPTQGRRVISLIPDHHIVVIDEDQIVQNVDRAIKLLDSSRPQTWISGPSATSDIELQRVEGVHGPRQLDVVIVRHPEANLE